MLAASHRPGFWQCSWEPFLGKTAQGTKGSPSEEGTVQTS